MLSTGGRIVANPLGLGPRNREFESHSPEKGKLMRNIVFTLILLLGLTLSLPTIADSDNEWYRTQVGSGIGNCGPACVAMSVNWATENEITVEAVRDFIGYTREGGATDFMELTSAMRKWNVPYDIEVVTTLKGLTDLVDRENLIAIVLIGTDGITYSPEEIFGRNYKYNGGHYIVLSEVVSNYFVVQDPMPDGADRRYHLEEVWSAMKDKRIILVRNYLD